MARVGGLFTPESVGRDQISCRAHRSHPCYVFKLGLAKPRLRYYLATDKTGETNTGADCTARASRSRQRWSRLSVAVFCAPRGMEHDSVRGDIARQSQGWEFRTRDFPRRWGTGQKAAHWNSRRRLRNCGNIFFSDPLEVVKISIQWS